MNKNVVEIQVSISSSEFLSKLFLRVDDFLSPPSDHDKLLQSKAV